MREMRGNLADEQIEKAMKKPFVQIIPNRANRRKAEREKRKKRGSK